MPQLDLLSIGDVTIDHFFFVEQSSIKYKKHTQQNLVCLPYAAKVPIYEYVNTTAGNSANVAVGAARLGLKVGLASIVGNDSGGREIIHKMTKEKVLTEALRCDNYERTNISSVLSYDNERTILVYHSIHHYHRLKLLPSRAYYLTSAGPTSEQLEILHTRVINALKKNPKIILGFNPGTYQLKLGLNKLKTILNHTKFLFLNKEEAEGLLKLKPLPIRALLPCLKKFAVPTVVITDGANGAWAITGKETWHQPIFPAPIVERTGAGDSFACGVMCAILKGKKLSEALRWGAANSAGVIGKIGPQAGLLTRHSMVHMLRRYRTIQPNIQK